MSLFKSKEAAESFQAARIAKKAAAPKGGTQFEILAAENAMLRDTVRTLKAELGTLKSDVTGLKQFRSEMESFAAEAKQRYAKQDKQIAAMGVSTAGGRTCPDCGEAHPDGPGYWPGYTSTTHPGDPRCANCFPKAG